MFVTGRHVVLALRRPHAMHRCRNGKQSSGWQLSARTQLQRAVLHQVQQAPRGGHNYVRLQGQKDEWQQGVVSMGVTSKCERGVACERMPLVSQGPRRFASHWSC